MKKDEFLQHVGVLGMKWGKRRNRSVSSDFKKSRELKKKHISELSDDELAAFNKRLNLEKTYKSLNPNKIKKGQNAVSNILKGIGTVAGTAASLASLIAIGQKIIKVTG